jgi:hypothetical protein
MNSLQRGFLCALAAPTLLLGACRAQPDLARRLNLDVWTLPEMQQEIAEGQRDLARGKEIVRGLRERSECRERIADEVAAGRMGLLQAAARFRDLNAAGPTIWYDPRRSSAGDSEEERCCRQVIHWVELRVALQSTEEAARVRDRLEQELGEWLQREGTLLLSQ